MGMSNRERVQRIGWLDSLRGVAVLGVILVHVSQIANVGGPLGQICSMGRYGVQLFFVISAVTICLTYEKAVAVHGNRLATAMGWYVKRLLRIAPLYYLAAVVYFSEYLYVSYALHQDGHLKHPVWDLVDNLLFIHTWIPEANNSVVPGGWSIGVEVMFYALLPILMIWKDKRYFTIFLGGLCLGSLCISAYVCKIVTGTSNCGNTSFFYYWFPTQFPVILLGCIFYLAILRRLAHLKFSHAVAAACIGIVALITAPFFGSWGSIYPLLAPILFGVFSCCVILLLRDRDAESIVPRFLGKMGTCSYSMYLVHFLVLDFARLFFHLKVFAALHLPPLYLVVLYAVVTPITFAISLKTRDMIELPGIAIGHAWSNRILHASDAALRG